MAISVADNFSYKGQKPLDARFQFSSVANMKAEPVANLYDGCLAYVTATKKYYTYDSSNTSTEETGKWAELQTGGGSSEGGHTIEDNGTEMTQRDTLNFVDFDLEDDTQNEKTVVQSHELTQEEFDEIFSTLPTMLDRSVVSNEANNLSLSEKVIGTWIDGKPLYQKTINFGALPDGTSDKSIAHNIANLGYIVSAQGSAYKMSSGTRIIVPFVATSVGNIGYAVAFSINDTNITVSTESDRSLFTESYFTLQYTKTTDSAVSSGEKIVGQWIDGKPIFEKVVDCGALPNNTTKQVDSGVTGISRVINMYGYAYKSSNYQTIPIGFPASSGSVSLSFYNDTGKVNITTTSDRSAFAESYVVIRYTKS